MENATWTSDFDANPSGARDAVLHIRIGDAFLPALKVTFDGQDGHLFLQRAGSWQEVALVNEIQPLNGFERAVIADGEEVGI